MNQSNHYSIFDYYLADIASAESLTREEEIFLAERISRGDQAAIHKLVTSNLRFVINIAKKYRNLGLPIEDLVSEGNVGLMVAARKFDGQHGYKFISYAVHWIRQAILQALAEQSRTVRVPQNRVADLNRLNRSESKLEQQLGRTPETNELAHAMKVADQELALIMTMKDRTLSMDIPNEDEGEDRPLIDLIPQSNETLPADAHVALSQEFERLRGAVSSLPDLEARILTMYFGLNNQSPMPLAHIGAVLGRTRERIRQLKVKAIERLRRREEISP